MNFYNPYYSLPGMMVPSVSGLGRLSRGLRGLSLSSIINGTQKTLNIVNQAIPIIKEAGPVMKNAKTMFKIANEFKKVDSPKSNDVNKITNKTTNEISEKSNNLGGPTFFI